VYALCGVHAMRNAHTTKRTAYAAVRNFCRAASESEQKRKIQVLEKRHKDIVTHIVQNCMKKISWLYLHKNKKLGCSFSITNTNGSEVTNNRVAEVRSLVHSDGLMQFCIRQSQDFSEKLESAQQYIRLGKRVTIILFDLFKFNFVSLRSTYSSVCNSGL